MPNRFVPIAGDSDLSTALKAINGNFAQLDSENVTKTFKGPNGNSIVEGRLPYGKYGQIYYDTDGTARILIGQHPVDGRMGIWQSKPGLDVIEKLSA